MNTLLDFINNYDEGVSLDQIRISLPNLSKEHLVDFLNKLINSNKITIFKKDGLVYYKSTSGSDDYESLLLNLISQSSTEGLWFREIKEKTNMPHNLAMKILRNLENKRLIKSMKCIKNNRKVYVLYDLVPSDDVTGGYWFNENEVDLECVQNIFKIVYQFIKKNTFIEDPNCLIKINNCPTLYEIGEYLNGLKILNYEIKEKDLKSLLDVMIYEDKIEMIEEERYTCVNNV
jgi:DNA-directed RNA polymerase III subunit RPC6